jgi:hypothetical protein
MIGPKPVPGAICPPKMASQLPENGFHQIW